MRTTRACIPYPSNNRTFRGAINSMIDCPNCATPCHHAEIESHAMLNGSRWLRCPECASLSPEECWNASLTPLQRLAYGMTIGAIAIMGIVIAYFIASTVHARLAGVA